MATSNTLRPSSASHATIPVRPVAAARREARGASGNASAGIRRSVLSLSEAGPPSTLVEPDCVLVGNGNPRSCALATRALFPTTGVYSCRPEPGQLYPLGRSRICGTGRPLPNPRLRPGGRPLVEGDGDGFGCCFVCRPTTLRQHAADGGGVRLLVAAAAARGRHRGGSTMRTWNTSPMRMAWPRAHQAGAGCLLLKTFSKAYGLAGSRVSYAVGPARLGRGRSSATAPASLVPARLTAAVAAVGISRTCGASARERAGCATHIPSPEIGGFGGPPPAPASGCLRCCGHAGQLSRLRPAHTLAIDGRRGGTLGYPRHCVSAPVGGGDGVVLRRGAGGRARDVPIRPPPVRSSEPRRNNDAPRPPRHCRTIVLDLARTIHAQS